ncbi:F0F1 ATP synthase subunit epsilon [Zavarzinia sp. CC-PAN008]|uniref:F0F1 ATP synthase subunit epsilon n=1 Tax=Zavarzinia sp. CC-PAN008 TaxID=3243332 RepID=UPI003F748829
MAETFQFELVSPERLLVSEPVEQVVVPGEEGDIGILAGHAPLVTLLRPGIIEVFRTEGGSPERIVVDGGFAEVGARTLTVLAERAQPLGEVDRAALEAEFRAAEQSARDARDDDARARAEARVTGLSGLLDSLR